MPKSILPLPLPGTGGYVTDKPAWELRAGETPDCQDQILTTGISTKRGGWSYHGEADPLNESPSGAKLIGCRAAEIVWQFEAPVFVSDDGGNIGMTGEAAGAREDIGNPLYADGAFDTRGNGTNPNFQPLVAIGDEVIFAPAWQPDDDNHMPLVRYAGHDGTAGTSSSTVSVTAGSRQVQLNAGSWSSSDVNQYIGIDDVCGDDTPIFRIMAVSGAFAQVDVPIPITGATKSYGLYPFGFVGVCSQIRGDGPMDGLATFPAADTSDVSTSGPNLSGGDYRPQLIESDIVGLLGDWDGYTRVESVGGSAYSNTIDISGNTTSVTSDEDNPWGAGRPLCGHAAVIWKDRLFAAGGKRNRLQWTPPLGGRAGGLSRMDNGDDSLATNYLSARLANYTYIPSEDVEGDILGLAVAPGDSLFVGRSNDCRIVFGDPPNLNSDVLLGPGILDRGGILSCDLGVFYVSWQGLHLYRGGIESRNVMEGKIAKEWQAFTGDWDEDVAFVSIGFIKRHLRLCAYNGTSEFHMVYDADRDVWCGPFSGTIARWQASYRGFEQDFTGSTEEIEECYWIPYDETTRQVATSASMFVDEGAAETGDNGGEYYLVTPYNLSGATNRLITPVQVKVTAEVEGSGTPTLNVQTGGTGITAATHDAIDGASSTGLREVICFPNHDVTAGSNPGALGLETKDFYVKLVEDTSNPATKIRVHAVEVVHRMRRQRV